MKLISLTIKNFLSYGNEEQTLLFDQSGIMAITGNNGHGKSALLEAITWACWGQARKGQGTSKSDDMVMRLGSNEMFVSLVIQIKDMIYKIHRKCEKKNNRILSNLEIYSIINQEEKNLSFAHLKDTQTLINTILGIDYEMFINTVYVKQGASDEFSKKTPKERKDLLCTILKINVIENTRQKILEDIKKIIEKRDVLLQLENKLLSKKKDDELAHIVILKEQSFKIIGEKKQLLEKIEQEIELLLIQKKTISASSEAAQSKKNKENDDISHLYNQYIKKKFLYEQYKKNNHDLQLLQQSGPQNIKSINNLLEAKEIAEKKFENDMLALKKKREIIENETLSTLQKIIEEENEFLKQSEINHILLIEEKIHVLNVELHYMLTTIQTNECKLCKNKITDITLLETKYNNISTQKKSLQENVEHYKTHKNQILFQCKSRKIMIEKEKKEAIEKINEEIETISLLYKNQIKHIDNEITAYHAIHTIEAQKDIIQKSITIFLDEKHRNQCKEIIFAIYDHKKVITIHSNAIEKNNILLNTIQVEVETKNNVKKLLIDEILKEEREYQKLESWIIILTKQQEEEKNELKIIQNNIIDEEKSLRIKSNLANILSKNNLQAAIIEESIPIIEKEANVILSKLTHGNAKIYIESIRDLKSGNIKETLDIKIADHVGLRYYEFFSGGEAFRIDLAIRIALIKLLTQKSGNLIKTFIIDEGFGSQDNQNLELIIDMLHILQNEFDSIIIISHLQEMKEQFATQLFIEKTISGSHIYKL